MPDTVGVPFVTLLRDPALILRPIASAALPQHAHHVGPRSRRLSSMAAIVPDAPRLGDVAGHPFPSPPDCDDLPPAIFDSLVSMWTEVLCADYLARHPDHPAAAPAKLPTVPGAGAPVHRSAPAPVIVGEEEK